MARRLAAVVILALALSVCGAQHESPQAATPANTSLPPVTHPSAGSFHPDATTLASCRSTSFTCYEQGFGNIAYRQGPEAAVALLGRDLAKDVPAVRGDCHTITHFIGSATLARYDNDPAKALAHGSMICGSGFYHGIVMYALRAARTPQGLVAKVRSLCSDTTVLTTTFLRYQCIHGLGHGLMIFSGDNLPWALTMCDKLADTWSQQSCSGGVFMQNFNPPSRMSPFRSRFVRKNDLLYPCDWHGVAERYKYYCFLQVTEHVLEATSYDWKATAATCAKATAPWSSVCFQSYGRDAAGASRYDPAAAYRLCDPTGTHLADCVFGVVRDFVNNDVGGRRGTRFCARVPASLRGYCFYGIGTILTTFVAPRELRHACRALSTRYERECAGDLTPAERKLVVVVPS